MFKLGNVYVVAISMEYMSLITITRSANDTDYYWLFMTLLLIFTITLLPQKWPNEIKQNGW